MDTWDVVADEAAPRGRSGNCAGDLAQDLHPAGLGGHSGDPGAWVAVGLDGITSFVGSYSAGLYVTDRIYLESRCFA